MQTSMQRGCSSSALASTSSHSKLCGKTFLSGRQVSLGFAQTGQTSRGQLQVVAVKGAGKKRQQQMTGKGAMGPPPVPPVDPNNVEFVIFIRALKFPQWYPLSIVKAGSAANALVRGLDNEWGKKLYGKTLVRNIAKSVYADKRNIEKSFRSQAPMMAKFTEFEYAFKIRDKSTPADWMQPENLTVLPKEENLGSNFLETLRERFTGKN